MTKTAIHRMNTALTDLDAYLFDVATGWRRRSYLTERLWVALQLTCTSTRLLHTPKNRQTRRLCQCLPKMFADLFLDRGTLDALLGPVGLAWAAKR